MYHAFLIPLLPQMPLVVKSKYSVELEVNNKYVEINLRPFDFQSEQYCVLHTQMLHTAQQVLWFEARTTDRRRLNPS